MSLIDEILERFGVRRTQPDAPEPTVYRLGGGWGDAIEWWPYESTRVMGWKRCVPCVGDVLLAPMQSGKMGRYRFVKVRRPGDPPDMFFADVEFVGYEGSS